MITDKKMTNKKAGQQIRKRGKDKAKDKIKRNGKFSTKHLRIKEELLKKQGEKGSK